MAGFMAGFGSAFANSFNQASAERHDRQQDMFKLQYADYISRRDIEEQRKREDAKVVKQAKMLASDAGAPEAWTDIHNRLQSGWKIKDVQDYLEEWEPEIVPITEQATTTDRGDAEPDAALSSKAESSVSAQMSERGTPAPQGGGIFGTLGEIFSPEANIARDQSRVTDRIASATGVSREDVLATLRPKSVETAPEPLQGKEGMQIKWKKKDPYKWIYEATDQDAAELNLLKAIESGDQKAVAIAKKAVELFQEPVDWWTAKREEAVVNLERAQMMGDQQGAEISMRVIESLDQMKADEDQHNLQIKLAEENRAVDRTIDAENRSVYRDLASEQRAEDRTIATEGRALERTLAAEDRSDLRTRASENRAEQRQIREEKRKEEPFDYLAENDPAKAKNNIIRAELSGSPEDVELARKVYENIAVEKELGTIREMKTQGKFFESSLGLAPGPNGNRTVIKRNGVWINPVTDEPVDDQSSVKPWTEEQEKFMKDIVGKVQEPARAINEKNTAFVQSIRDTQEMVELRQQFPESVTLAGWASSQANDWARNVQGLWNVATKDAKSDVFRDSTLNQLKSFEQELDRNLKGMMHGSMVDNVRAAGLAYALMQTKAIRAAYSQAKAIGAGSGQGLGQREYERILGTFMNPDSVAFIQDRQDYLSNQYETLKQESAAFNEFDPQVQLFKTQMDLESLPVTPVMDIDQLLVKDPRAKAFLDRMVDQKNSLNPDISNPDQLGTKTPVPQGVELTPEEKTLWDSLSDRGRELLLKSKGKSNAVKP